MLNLDAKLETLLKTAEDDGCRVSCYSTVTNSNTGISETFTASSTSSDCAEATLDCYGKAMKQALKYIGDN